MDKRTKKQMNLTLHEYAVTINIATSFRLGRKDDNKTRTLKIMLAEKSQGKFILDNARFIPTKIRGKFKDEIISKNLTRQQREDRRRHIMNKKGTRCFSKG